MSTPTFELGYTNPVASVAINIGPLADAVSTQAAQQAAASQTAAANSATAAAGSASTASTSATNAANSASASATSATASSNSASAAATSATNAATSESNAATSATASATSATASSNSATAASRSESNASTSASNAAGSASAASGSATAAATSATNAATSATNASTSAGAAATSATNAATSATNASASAGTATAQATTATQQATVASSATSNALSLYGSASALSSAQTAASTSALTATAQAALAATYAASAASVAQQDLSGVTGAALHRSPNGIVAQTIYETWRDSDGGAWIDSATWQSWANEPLNGPWLPATASSGIGSELEARCQNSTVGAEIITAPIAQTNWTVSGTGGTRTAGGASSSIYQSGLTVNAIYRVTVVVTALASGGGVDIQVGSTNLTNAITSTGTHVRYVQNTGASTTAYLNSASAVTVASWSVKPVTGFNTAVGSFYPSASDGKFYRVWKNLLQYSEQLSNAVWIKDGTGPTVTDNYMLGPNGTQATRLQFSVSGRANRIRQSIASNTAVLKTPMTISFRAKGEAGGEQIGVWNGWNDLDTSITLTTAWQQFTFTFTPANTSSGPFLYAVTGTPNIEICELQYELGSAATSYELKTADISQTEVFRGNTSKFPRAAGFIVEGARVIIYDLLTPGRPMWMVFWTPDVNSGFIGWAGTGTPALTGVAAANGRLAIVGSAQTALLVCDFVKDQASVWSNADFDLTGTKTIANRNAACAFISLGTSARALASNTLTSVAMTVRPDAPFDPATGLQVPTIAVATNAASGGINVIRHDGTVTSTAYGSLGVYVSFDARGNVVSIGENSRNYRKTWAPDYTNYTTFTGGALQLLGTVNSVTQAPFNKNFGNFATIYKGGNAFGLLRDNDSAASAPYLYAELSAYYNTGWMAGDIRRCWLSSNVAESIGPVVELVANGTFNTDLTGWSSASSYPSTAADVSGEMQVTASGSFGRQLTTITTTPGKVYLASGLIRKISGAGNAVMSLTTSVGGDVDGANYIASTQSSTATAVSFKFTATSATSYIGCGASGANAGDVFGFDNISVQQVEPDRSYKNQPLTIYGTLAKTLVGGLAMYSGWSASNYLQQAYSADLDPGTGAWRWSDWLNIPVGTAAPANFFTNSEFPNGLADTPTHSATLVTAVASMAGPNGTTTGLAFGYDGTTDVYAYKSNYMTVAGVSYTISAYVVMDDGLAPSAGSAGLNAQGGGTAFDFGFVVGNSALNGPFTVTQISGSLYRVSATISSAFSASVNNGIVKYHTNSTRTFKVTGYQIERGTLSPYHQTLATAYTSAISCAFDRSAATGPYVRAGLDVNACLAVEAYDGTTTRRATSTISYNTATQIKASFEYTTDGTLTVGVNGNSVGTATGNPLLTLNNVSAVLTVGNARTLDAAFPGSIGLLKAGMTVPTAAQKAFMFLQENAMWQPNAVCTLPDSGSVVDMDYDAQMDRLKVLSAANESSWQGLVSVGTSAVSAGSFTKTSHRSGIKLLTRGTTNPGVDVTVPSQSLMSELFNRSQKTARLARLEETFDWVGGFSGTQAVAPSAQITGVTGLSYPAQTTIIGAAITGTGVSGTVQSVSGTTITLSNSNTQAGAGTVAFTDFILPVGYEAKSVLVNGTFKQEGSTKDWTRLYDGFRETIRFAVAPGYTAWIEIKARRSK